MPIKLKNHFKKNNIKIYKYENWIDLFLERYPSSILNEKYFASNFKSSVLRNFENIIKRLGDISFSLILLFITFPLVILSCLFVFLDDGFPIFYKQVRVGYENEKFYIYKIRTMKVNAEDNGVQWAKREDTRLTRFGKFLRLSRIDELPQIFQVLTGKMRLIGPRPERPEIESLLIKEIDNYDLRKKIKPGLSGWAQVNFPYGSSVEDSKAKLSYDLYYLKNFFILLDFLIMMKTIRLVANFHGSRPTYNKEILNRIN